jgi:hypothetical protein
VIYVCPECGIINEPQDLGEWYCDGTSQGEQLHVINEALGGHEITQMERVTVVEACAGSEGSDEGDESRCGHRAPLNYDHTRWATCTRGPGHDDEHDDGERVWTDRTMPYRHARDGRGNTDGK